MLSRRLLRIKVVKALYAHFKSEPDSAAASVKNLRVSIDRSWELYLQMMWLVVDVSRYAEKRIELGRKKRLPTHEDLHPNTRFVENEAVRQIADSDSLAALLKNRSLGWVNHPEVVKTLYNAMAGSDYYRAYMDADAVSYKTDVRLVEDFFIETVQDNEMVEEAVEEQSIMWADDVDFALSMVVRTLGSMRRSHGDIPLMPEFKNDDDEVFGPDLFRAALRGYDEYVALIERFTENWDMERIAVIDTMIMVAAIAELVNFPSIPVKVTLDEYIEIAKYYSTRGSGTFVNGILDKAIASLTADGKIAKTGRGLI